VNVDVTYIIVGVVCALVGCAAGYKLGHKIGLLRVFRTALMVKNPEMWDLLHHYVVDEKEQETATHRRAVRPPEKK
jgi:hypothetical protein